MWKLTVERNYVQEIGEKKYESTDRVYFEAVDITALENVVKRFRDFGTDGEYKYHIDFIERGCKKEC